MTRRVLAALAAGPLTLAAGLMMGSQAHAADCAVNSYLQQTSYQTSDEVACVQQVLNDSGYDSGPVDGWFGPITEGAVVAYQSANGLTVDGQVGSETAGALGVWGNVSSSSDTTSSSSDSANSNVGATGWDYSSGGTTWDALAECESGGNWSINTGNGYYGGLQFLVSTWQAYGGSGYPHENSREEQIRVAENLRADAGYSPWPSCSAQLGL